ncbi:DUF2149 domain-containing protein [uncultured Victivallis sp.]|uniref:DUF2149 domain-containing protein n=1 Tax=uncultured Victivallis sp. TaxID=354118 RepID=UPI0025F267B7|nr:DUF2149 domain-containing protein [uncultured Victivallis sp.]
MKKRRYSDLFRDEDEVDPRSSLMNLFDAAMVFAVALMVAFAIQSRMTEFLTAEDATFVKNAGRPDMEIIVKKENKVTRYKSEKTTGSGRGQRVGIAYRLESGEVIYVPEGEN